MAAVSQCPPPSVLRQLVEHGGPNEEIEGLAAHLETCESCGRLLETCVAEDPTLASLRAGAAAELPKGRVFLDLRERLRGLRPAAALAADNEETMAAAQRDTVSSSGAPEDKTEAGVDFLGAPLQADEIGRLGSYRVLKKLGAGGMGVVFLAEDTLLHRKVALKTMLPSFAANAVAKERFLREARSAAAVEHEHIVAIHQVGEDNGVPFLAMPLLKGEALDDRLKRERMLPVHEAVRIAAEMAEGLAAAHDSGLVHRDVKPGNVWLEGSKGKVKLLDFGLARAQLDDARLTQSGAIVGTPAFMAPEQARNDAIDGRADLFSLGAVLYTMLTGNRPFPGENTLSVLTALALDNPPAPLLVRLEVSAELSDLTMRLLAKNAADRPESARATAVALRELLQANSDQTTASLSAVRVPASPARSQDSRPHAPREEHKRRTLVPAIAAALLLLAGGAFALYEFVIKTPNGTMLVQIDDKEVEARFKNGELQILDKDGKVKYTLKPGERSKDMPPGAYRIKVIGADGLAVDTDEFTMKNGDKVTVRVKMLPVGLAKLDPVKEDPKVVGNLSEPGMPAKDRDKPFVQVLKGVEAGAHQTFAAAFLSLPAGHEIHVHGNGPFFMPHVEVADSTLVLKAAPGFRPVFLPDPTFFRDKEYILIQLKNAGLTIEGCDFRMRGMPYGPGRLPPRLFTGGDRPCVLRGCRLIGFFELFYGVTSSALVLEDCLLLSSMLGSLNAGCELTLTNNLICCHELVSHFQPPGGQKVRLTRNAIVTRHRGLTPKVDDKVNGVTVTAEGNLFNCKGDGNATGWPIMTGGFKNQLRWQGKDNWYAGLTKGLAAWNAETGEAEFNSREAPSLPFGWLVDMPGEADKAVPWWATRLAEARKQTGLGDMGPDLALVGPGDAYTRGLAAEGKAVPKEQLRSRPLESGPIVLLRDGKPERGFVAPQDAFDAVQDGDVIEIRSDAGIKGGSIPKDRGGVILRAGPGYRPTIQSSITVRSSGTSLAVEGLVFSSQAALITQWVKDLPLEKQGRISRLAYCAFEIRPDGVGSYAANALFMGKDGSPGEVLRCVISRRIIPRADKDTAVRFRECVLQDVLAPQVWDEGRWPNLKPMPSTIELEACLLGMARITGDAGTFHQEPRTYRWIARRCLFESNYTLLMSHNNMKPAWTGEKNCYRIGMEWVNDGGTTTYCLSQWRAHGSSQEAGSVEGEPLIADPRRWKLLPGSAAAGFGPDVDRVARLPDRVESVPPAAPIAKIELKDKVKPFVLTRAGKEVRSFAALHGALDVLQSGDVIEIHGNGPFEIPSIEFNRDLTLRAAAGYRPRFVPSDDFFEGNPFGFWFKLKDASLAIEGCDFIARGPDAKKRVSFLGGTGTGCSVRNCRMVGLRDLFSLKTPKVEMEDSLVVCTFLGSYSPKTKVVFRNNCVWGASADLQAPGGQALELHDNTFLVNGGGNVGNLVGNCLIRATAAKTGAKDVTVIAGGNIYDSSPSFSGASFPVLGGDAKIDWRSLVSWQGKQNLYRRLGSTPPPIGWPGGTGLAAWNKYLPQPEKDSSDAAEDIRYTLLKPAPGDFAGLQPALRQQVESARNPSGSADLGPDFTLLGPGDAYVRALEAAGDKIPKEQLRLEVPRGGPVVLLRAGQIVKGFATLALALAQAQDGDTVEVRADRTVESSTVPPDRGVLTIRAGRGYRPILVGKECLVSSGTTLILEGFHFRGAGITTGPRHQVELRESVLDEKRRAKQGRIARVANCSFEKEASLFSSIGGRLESADGKSGEIVNCLIPERMFIMTATAAPATIRNCVLAGIEWVTYPDSKPALTLDRCLIWNTDVGNKPALVLANSPKEKFALTARRTLFETTGPLVWGGNDVCRWQGSHNLYRVGHTWEVSRVNSTTLAVWRQETGSKEEGSVLGDPLLWDPRQWRLLPGSPGYQAGPGGKDLGADVDRVARPTAPTAGKPATPIAGAGSNDDAWLKQVAAMPAAQQVDAVKAKLVERNPGFDGKLTPQIKGAWVIVLSFPPNNNLTDISPVRALTGLQTLVCAGAGKLADLSPLKDLQLTTLQLNRTKVADLSPLKNMKLTSLDIQYTMVSDLAPLKEMKLTFLNCMNTQVSDLAPLKEMKLTTLLCDSSRVADLAPLKDMKLTVLSFSGTKVSDLSPLKDMKLARLHCGGTQVSDLSPLQGMPLTFLACLSTPVSDLAPLKGMPLATLDCRGIKVIDLSPLKGMPLRELVFEVKAERDAAILRSLKTLEKINSKPAAEFWKEVEAEKP